MFTNERPTLIIVTYNTVDQFSGLDKIKSVVTTPEDVSKFLISETNPEDLDTQWRVVSIEKYDGLTEDMVQTLCWIKDIQAVIQDVQKDVESGIETDIESAVEKIIQHSVLSATRLLEARGYVPAEPDHDLMGK